ncbi:DUF397 domain-containing protein [Streptomyces netropsis]|uniref:DUF397 domain-containing protein n=1 Tax=Streptomyces netropsis TaxID=55404 RepID=UPI0030CEFD8F
MSELKWFKSRYSGEDGDSCVEVATLPTAIHVRDSKVADGPRLTLSPEAWSAFTAFARTAD